MTQVNHSPGVPGTLATVTASSASPIIAMPVFAKSGPILGTGVVSTGGVLSWVSSTGATNVWSSSLIESAKVVTPFKSSTPIVLPTQVGGYNV